MFHKHYAIATAALSLALTLGTLTARAETGQFYGRWTVSDDKPAYSTNGKLYKTIDMAPCGKDFCGIAVDDKNHCGKTLFRFFTTHPKNEDLVGHGVWGSEKKKLVMGYAKPENFEAYVYLGLGADDMDLTGREGSEPTFNANYKKIGKAKCTANSSNPQT